MAQFDGLTKAKAEAIIGASVVSAVINGAGHLILTRNNGETIDAGDFTSIVQDTFDAQLDAAIDVAVPEAITGIYEIRSAVSGAVVFTDYTSASIVNAFIRLNLSGNVTITAPGAFPANCKPGTKFYVLFKQDNPNGATNGGGGANDTGWTGGRTLTITGLKTTPGQLYQEPGGYDIISFFWDGMYWHGKKEYSNITP